MYTDTPPSDAQTSSDDVAQLSRPNPHNDEETIPPYESIQFRSSYDVPSAAWTSRLSRDEASHLLLGGRATPQPLSDPLDGDVPMYEGRYLKRRRSLREHCFQKRICKWIAAVAGLLLLALAITAITNSAEKEENEQEVTPTPVVLAPVGTTQLASSSSGEAYPIRWPARCHSDYETNSVMLDFGSTADLHIQESIHTTGDRFKRISGWIHVARAPDGQSSAIQAKLSYAVSKSAGNNPLEHTASANELIIGDVRDQDGGDATQRASACLMISTVLYIVPGTVLENLDISSTYLGVQVHEGVELSVTNKTSISVAASTVDLAPFNSRETRIETISGSISGQYALLDHLSFRTITGSVNVDIVPKEPNDDLSRPAVFTATSLSGSIRADFETKNIPARDYRTTIDTKMGSIDGSFIHGSSTVIQSVEGSVNAELLPYNVTDRPSTIKTSTDSGQMKIKILSPYPETEKALAQLTSTHQSISGMIDLTYPQEWSGRVEGSAVSGKIHLQGRDLELVHKSVDVPGGSTLVAKKGEGSSAMQFNSNTGSCEVRVGELGHDV